MNLSLCVNHVFCTLNLAVTCNINWWIINTNSIKKVCGGPASLYIHYGIFAVNYSFTKYHTHKMVMFNILCYNGCKKKSRINGLFSLSYEPLRTYLDVEAFLFCRDEAIWCNRWIAIDVSWKRSVSQWVTRWYPLYVKHENRLHLNNIPLLVLQSPVK